MNRKQWLREWHSYRTYTPDRGLVLSHQLHDQNHPTAARCFHAYDVLALRQRMMVENPGYHDGLSLLIHAPMLPRNTYIRKLRDRNRRLGIPVYGPDPEQ